MVVQQLEVDVVVTKRFRHILLSLIILFSHIQKVMAEMMEKGKTKVKTVYNIYQQSGNGGKQVFDNSGSETVTVMEPMIFIEHQISKTTAITSHFVWDFFTAASDTIIDGNTGASAAASSTRTSQDDDDDDDEEGEGGGGVQGQDRIAGNIGIKREVDKWAYGAAIGISKEYDYESINYAFDLSRSFAQDNFTVGVGFQIYDDKVAVYKDLSPVENASLTTGLSRKIKATSISASQILSSKDIIQFGYTHVQATGSMESSSSTILLNGVREAEVMPSQKIRNAFSTKWVHGFGEGSAINLEYRSYSDNWGLTANTYRFAYLFEVNDNEDFIEVFTRLHSQTNVDFYQESFDSNEEFMTSDSDLAAFKSKEFGIYHSYSIGDFKSLGFEFENVKWGNSFTYSNRDNGLSYGYYQTSIGLEF